MFRSYKGEYEKQKENLITNQEQNSNTRGVLEEITNQFHHNLLVLTAETKKPNLVVTI
jgi:hypothetical protein